MTTIIGIVACRNRRETTLRAIRSLLSHEMAGVDISAVVVDDGSSDGTPEALDALGRGELTVLRGDGSLYWAKAMHWAEQIARAEDPDHLLWLNDDVVLNDGGLSALLTASAAFDDAAIVVGAIVDPLSGAVTYSGVRRTRHPLRFERVAPDGTHRLADTFNGNVVLVPRTVYSNVGTIDGLYGHGAADYDYGLRAGAQGVQIVVSPKAVGSCARDHMPRPWLDRSRPLLERLRLVYGPKGLSPRTYGRFLRRHGGPIWPVFLVTAYGRFIVSLLPLGRKRQWT